MQNYPPYQQLSFFPQQNYQQPYQPQYQQTYQQQSQQQTGIVWVSTEDEAKNYPVAPGGTVYLMNQSEPYFYAKSADSMGRPTFKKSRLVDESEPQKKRLDLTEYVKREEIENIVTDRVQKEVEKRMSEISFKPAKRSKTVTEDDE